MARVHVQAYRETYRGVLSDDLLDNPDFVSKRERFWTAVLTDDWYAHNRVAVAESDGSVIGLAMSGLPEESDPSWQVQLYVLYVLAEHQRSGTGSALLDAVATRYRPIVLWVTDPNPPAQAFFAKHGFSLDGTHKIEEVSVRSVRMVRPECSDPSA